MSSILPRVRVGTEYTRRLHPIDCRIRQTLQPLSTVSMTLPPEEWVTNLDWVEVPAPDGSTGYYRVSSVSTDMETGNQDVYLEHGACLLDDTIIPNSGHYIYATGKYENNAKLNTLSKTDTIMNLLTYILGWGYKWTVGTVEATATVHVDLGELSVMTALLTMMQSIPDYQIYFVQNGVNDWHVDIKARPTVPTCEGRLSRNLQSCEVSYSTDGICTRVLADGITNGMMDSDKITQYGVYVQTMTLNDALSLEQKEAIVSAYLNAHDHPAVSVSISGLELSQVTGVDFDKFSLGAVCRIAVPWLDVIVDEVIIDKSYSDPYNNPEAVKFTLANAAPDLSITIAALTGGGGGGGGRGGSGKGGLQEQKKRFTTKFEQSDTHFRMLASDNEWDKFGNDKPTAYAQLVVTSSSIQSVVNDIANSGYSSITQMANNISLVVTKTDTGGVINGASIALAINNDGTGVAKINAERIYLTGQSVYLSYALSNTLNCTTLSSVLTVANNVISNGYQIANNNNTATWKSKTVVTGASSRTGTKAFALSTNGTSITSILTANVITGLETETIYYLGHT